jgi:hypothetical protein
MGFYNSEFEKSPMTYDLSPLTYPTPRHFADWIGQQSLHPANRRPP